MSDDLDADYNPKQGTVDGIRFCVISMIHFYGALNSSDLTHHKLAFFLNFTSQYAYWSIAYRKRGFAKYNKILKKRCSG